MRKAYVTRELEASDFDAIKSINSVTYGGHDYIAAAFSGWIERQNKDLWTCAIEDDKKEVIVTNHSCDIICHHITILARLKRDTQTATLTVGRGPRGFISLRPGVLTHDLNRRQ